MFAPSPRVNYPVFQKPQSFTGGKFDKGIYTYLLIWVLIPILGSVTILTFDLVCDWLLYKELYEDHFQERISNYLKEIPSENHYFHSRYLTYVSQDVLYICSVSSALYAAIIIHFIIAAFCQRQCFLNKRDGLFATNLPWLYVMGELLFFVHVSLEDLVLSWIIVAIQATVSCHFLYSTDENVLKMCMISTATNLVWNVIRMLWYSGIYKSYNVGTCQSILIKVCRVFTLAAVLIAAISTILNGMILYPNSLSKYTAHAKQFSFGNILFDKVGINQWLSDDGIVIQKFDLVDSVSNVIRVFNVQQDVVQLQTLAKHKNVVVSLPCAHDQLDFRYFLPDNIKKTLGNNSCEILFKVAIDQINDSIIYQVAYKVYSKDDCASGPILISRFEQEMVVTTATACKNCESNVTSISHYLEMSFALSGVTNTSGTMKAMSMCMYNLKELQCYADYCIGN